MIKTNEVSILDMGERPGRRDEMVSLASCPAVVCLGHNMCCQDFNFNLFDRQESLLPIPFQMHGVCGQMFPNFTVLGENPDVKQFTKQTTCSTLRHSSLGENGPFWFFASICSTIYECVTACLLRRPIVFKGSVP